MPGDANDRPTLTENGRTKVPVKVNVPREVYQDYVEWAWRENRRPDRDRLEKGPAVPAARLIDHIDIQPRYFVDGEEVDAYNPPNGPGDSLAPY